METRILVVDNDKTFVKGLKYSLEQEGFIVDTFLEERDILERVAKGKYNLVLLGIGLANSKGLNMCKSIREVSNVPIIVMMEKGDDIDIILALEQGADDYAIKPFNILVFKAKIKAILRRENFKSVNTNNQIIKISDFTINTVGRKVTIKDKDVNLTGKEFDLFYVLISNPGEVFKREELLELVWGYAYYGDLRTVDVHIRRIREKIEKNASDHKYIMTKWGVGYYFNNSNL